jgi:hypothetical protein
MMGARGAWLHLKRLGELGTSLLFAMEKIAFRCAKAGSDKLCE